MSKAIEKEVPKVEIVSREYVSPCGGEKRVEEDGSIMAGVLIINGWKIVEEVVEV